MNVLYIPGFSAKNLAEMNVNSQALESSGHSVTKVNWEHWGNPDASWNLEIALELIRSLKVTPDIIVAKSIGTLGAVNFLKETQFSKIILLGIPVLDLSEEDLKSYSVLKDFKNRVVLVHNRFDNHGTLEDLSKHIDLSEFDVRVVEADHHSYQYPELVTQLVNE